MSLPSTGNVEGRPIWEPPIFTYSELIGEEYEDKRKALLKHYGGDRAKTTEYLDVEDECRLLRIYCHWAGSNRWFLKELSTPGPEWHHDTPDKLAKGEFFLNLIMEIHKEEEEIVEEGRLRNQEDQVYLARDDEGDVMVLPSKDSPWGSRAMLTAATALDIVGERDQDEEASDSETVMPSPFPDLHERNDESEPVPHTQGHASSPTESASPSHANELANSHGLLELWW